MNKWVLCPRASSCTLKRSDSWNYKMLCSPMTLLYVNSVKKKDWKNHSFTIPDTIFVSWIYYPNLYFVVYKCQMFLQGPYKWLIFKYFVSLSFQLKYNKYSLKNNCLHFFTSESSLYAPFCIGQMYALNFTFMDKHKISLQAVSFIALKKKPQTCLSDGQKKSKTAWRIRLWKKDRNILLCTLSFGKVPENLPFCMVSLRS